MSEYARNLDTYGDGGSDKDWPLCPNCGGTGACYPCGGKGTIGPQNETSCPECHGNGLCVACGGMGQDIPPVPDDMFDGPTDTWEFPL